MRRVVMLVVVGVLAATSSARADAPVPTSVFESPHLDVDATGLTVSTTGLGGVEFEYVLDPRKTYRLTLDGRTLSGRFTARLRRGNGTYEYRLAPTGRDVFRLTGVASVELLLFNDRQASYRVTRVELEECADCPGAADLRAQILGHARGSSALSP